MVPYLVTHPHWFIPALIFGVLGFASYRGDRLLLPALLVFALFVLVGLESLFADTAQTPNRVGSYLLLPYTLGLVAGVFRWTR